MERTHCVPQGRGAILMGKAIRKRELSMRLAVAAQELNNVQGKAGFFESAKYPDGTPVAYVAAIQEFGYAEGGIPPRSFMRTTANEQGKHWTEAFSKGAKAIVRGTFSPKQVMDAVGQLAAGDIRKKISEIQSPPLEAATVAARRRRYANKGATGNLTKPLVDTAIMVNSVTNIVEEKA